MFRRAPVCFTRLGVGVRGSLLQRGVSSFSGRPSRVYSLAGIALAGAFAGAGVALAVVKYLDSEKDVAEEKNPKKTKYATPSLYERAAYSVETLFDTSDHPASIVLSGTSRGK